MPTTDSEAQFIDVNELRIGMFVYLDLGWMKHPFALNSFKISSREQIDTILGLGINRIRWSPAQSDPDPATAAAVPPQPAPKVGTDGTAARQAVVEAVAVEAEVRRQRRERLNEQRECLEACERQFASAARSYRQIIDAVGTQPEAAREQSTQLIDGMVDKIFEHEESAIRLLSENAGEKGSLHTLNVTVIALLLGKALGLDGDALKVIGMGALLHDIGKIRLPERLRGGENDYSSAERKIFQEHVAHGVTLGKTMKLPADVLAVIGQHHELADGRGYPQQLAGDKIVLPARIVSLVNHYDNLCNPSNPAQAITPHEALSQIFAQMKRQFDSHVMTLFIRMMGVYPPGSIVELTDGRHALVVSVNSARPLKPQIVIFEPRIPRNEALVEDLENFRDLGIRRSLKPIQLPRAAFDYLSPRQRMCYFFERARQSGDDSPPP